MERSRYDAPAQTDPARARSEAGVRADRGVTTASGQVVDLARLLLLARAVHQVGEGVAVFDNDDRLIYANPAVAAMYGVAAAELEGRHLRTFAPSSDVIKSEQLQGEADGMEVTRSEISVLGPDGTKVAVRVTVSVLRDGSGDRIGRVVCVLDITDQKTLEAKLEHAALHDPLTGLMNRRLLSDRLDHALAVAARTHSPVAVLFIDLDSFKLVNDTHGHSFGDRLLIEAAHRLERCTRESDTLARWGGDEFILLVEGLDDDETASTIANEILDVLAQPFEIHDVTLHLSASVGIAATLNSRPRDLLHAADAAMYQAKRIGPGNIVHQPPTPNN